MAGIDEISKEFNPRCPHCHGALSMREYVKELFSLILARLSKGERVQVSGFGSFNVTTVKARKIPSLDGTIKDIPPRKVIRFRASQKAKTEVNSESE